MNQKEFSCFQPLEQGLDSTVLAILNRRSEEDLDIHFSGFIRPANQDINIGYVSFAVIFSKKELVQHSGDKHKLINLLILKLESNLRMLQDKVKKYREKFEEEKHE